MDLVKALDSVLVIELDPHGLELELELEEELECCAAGECAAACAVACPAARPADSSFSDSSDSTGEPIVDEAAVDAQVAGAGEGADVKPAGGEAAARSKATEGNDELLFPAFPLSIRFALSFSSSCNWKRREDCVTVGP